MSWLMGILAATAIVVWVVWTLIPNNDDYFE
jgi:hypothetical protein